MGSGGWRTAPTSSFHRRAIHVPMLPSSTAVDFEKNIDATVFPQTSHRMFTRSLTVVAPTLESRQNNSCLTGKIFMRVDTSGDAISKSC
jgi:hypothetical protein